jgi:hypothetical protein
MTRIAGELLDIKVVEVLREVTPRNDKRMRNADRRSSRPIGDPSIPFNAGNLGDNGNINSGSVMPALNTENTPRWMENDRTRQGYKRGGKRKVRSKTENRERRWGC